MTYSPDISPLIQRIYAADEALDAKAFVSLLTADVNFRLGSYPPAIGREAVHRMVADFFTTIAGLKHHLLEVWERDNTIIFQAEVTYTRPDRSQVTLPYMDVLKLDGDRVKDYKIYIDLAPL
jgi:SnoaL-like domain